MRRTRTLIISLLTVVLLAGLVSSFGCAKPAEPVEEEKLQIISVFQWYTDPFFAPTKVGMDDAAEDYGVDFQWLGSPTGDILETISLIETVLAKGDLDGLIVEADDPEDLIPALKQVKEAGIPIVCTNELYEHPYLDSFCGADGIEVGEIQGKELESTLLGKSVWAEAVGYEGTGEVEGEIAFLLENPGSLNVEMRVKGSRDYLSQFPGIVDVGLYNTTIDMATARETVANIVTANPDLTGFCSVGSTSTVAVGIFLEDSDLVGKIVNVGMDLMPQEMELVKNGVVACVIGQNPYAQGYLPVEALYNYLANGTPIPTRLPTELEVVDLSNIDSIIAREEAYMGE